MRLLLIVLLGVVGGLVLGVAAARGDSIGLVAGATLAVLAVARAMTMGEEARLVSEIEAVLDEGDRPPRSREGRP